MSDGEPPRAGMPGWERPDSHAGRAPGAGTTAPARAASQAVGAPAPVDGRWVLALVGVLTCVLALPPGEAGAAAAVSTACVLGAGVAIAASWALRAGGGGARGGASASAAVALALICTALTAQSAAQREHRLDAADWNRIVADEATTRLEASLRTAPRERTDRFGARRSDASVEVRAHGPDATRLPHPVPALLTIPGDGAGLTAGDDVCVVAEVASAQGTTILRARSTPRPGPCRLAPGEVQAQSRAPGSGESADETTGRERLRGAFRDAAAGGWARSPELIPALVLGDRSVQSDALDQAMKDAGLSHLSAVSGANCALICGAVTAVLRALRVHRRVVLAAVLGSLVAFVVLIGPEPSVLRAATMGGLGALALFAGRGRQAFSLLCVAGTALVVADPALGREPALHLSLAATAGIVLGARPAECLLRRALDPLLPGWASAWVAVSLAVTGTAHLACQPVLILMTGTVSTYAVPANLVAAPFVPVVTVLGTLAAACALLVPWLCAALVGVVQVPAGVIGAVAEAAASLPRAVRPWPEGGVGAALFALVLAATAVGFAWLLAHEHRPRAPVRRRGAAAERRRHGRADPRTVAAAGLACAVLAAGAGGYTAVIVPPPAAGADERWVLAFCDVGQGDMTLVRSGDDSAVVVDAGPEPETARACLERLRVRRVDALLLTHLHADHVGGLAGVADRLAPGAALAYATADHASSGEAGDTSDPPSGAVRMRTGDAGRAGHAHWQVLHADPRASRENDASAQVLLRTGPPGVPTTTVLVTGDLQDEAAARWLATSGSRVLPEPGAVDVLKVAHHGALNGGLDVPQRVQADLHVVSVGADNTYGHPHPRTVDGLAQIAPVARTDLSGTLVLHREEPVPGAHGEAGNVDERDDGTLTVRGLGPDGDRRRRMGRMAAARTTRSSRGRAAANPLAWRTAQPGPLTLLKGPEDYAARWVTDRIRAELNARHGQLEVHSMRAGDYQTGQLLMAASPSLFAEPTLILVDGLEAMNDAFLQDALELVAGGPAADDVTLVLRHAGGNRGKKLLDAVAKAGVVIECPALKKDEDRMAFVSAEFRDARRRIDDDAVRALVAATGSSLTDLASACRQLIDDTESTVTREIVDQYYGGRVEATSFAVADATLEGQAARAVALTRHALATGVHPVMLSSALAMKARQVARIIDARVPAHELASSLGVAPFQVKYIQQAARHWSAPGIASALEWIAQADAEVKGGSRNADFAIERAVIRVATATRR